MKFMDIIGRSQCSKQRITLQSTIDMAIMENRDNKSQCSKQRITLQLNTTLVDYD